jgi:hypothetical protein
MTNRLAETRIGFRLAKGRETGRPRFGDALKFASVFLQQLALSSLLHYGENSGDSMHAKALSPTSWHYQIFFQLVCFQKCD